MASIDDLVRPKADFDPETIVVLCAALDEAWDLLLQSGSECTRPAYVRAMREVVCGASSIWRSGASGIKKSLPMVLFVFLLRTIDLSADGGMVLRERYRAGGPSRDYGRRQRTRPATAVTIAWSTFGSVTPLKGFRPPHMASG